MENKMCTLFSFLSAAKGNWRNSIYIECHQCNYGKKNLCPGFLLIPDYDGQPVVIPDSLVERMTGLGADKNECLAVLYRQDFESLYSLWLEWNVSSSNECALMQIVKQNSCGRADKGFQCCFQKII
jgi:hypothetical protein